MFIVTFRAIINNVWKKRIERFNDAEVEAMNLFIKKFLKRYPNNSYYFINKELEK